MNITIGDVIAYVDAIKPNTRTQEEKIMWLNSLDTTVYKDIICTHKGYETVEFNGYTVDTPSTWELLIPTPYTEVYRFFLEMQIDLANAEFNKYNSSSALFNSAYENYEKYYHSNNMPLQLNSVNYGKTINTNAPSSGSSGNSNIDTSAILQELKRYLKNYITREEAKLEFDNKEDTKNKVVSFDKLFVDKENNKYPTVTALLSYLNDYYYTYDEMIGFFKSMTIADNGDFTIVIDGESILIGNIKGAKGDKGDPYTLTESDINTITNKVLESFIDVSEVGL